MVSTKHLRGTLATGGVLVAMGALGYAVGSPLAALPSDTQSTQEATNLTTGTVRIGTQSGTYTAPMANLLPGQERQVTLDVANSGSLPWGKLELKVTGTGALADNPVQSTKAVQGPLGADGTASTVPATWGKPLTLKKVEACSVPWVQGVCSGEMQEVTKDLGTLKTPGIITAYEAKGSMPQVPPGGKVSLRLTYELPADAGEAYDGEGATLSYAFTVTQRPGRILP